MVRAFNNAMIQRNCGGWLTQASNLHLDELIKEHEHGGTREISSKGQSYHASYQTKGLESSHGALQKDFQDTSAQAFRSRPQTRRAPDAGSRGPLPRLLQAPHQRPDHQAAAAIGR